MQSMLCAWTAPRNHKWPGARLPRAMVRAIIRKRKSVFLYVENRSEAVPEIRPVAAQSCPEWI
jgi:hypothetical protein